jgi:hypothetical protein
VSSQPSAASTASLPTPTAIRPVMAAEVAFVSGPTNRAASNAHGTERSERYDIHAPSAASDPHCWASSQSTAR